MKYLLLCCFDEKRWETIAPVRREEIMREYAALMRGLYESGQHLASAQLQPVSTAATVRSGNGKLSVTDGPFAETKEQLGGYHVIECRDFEEAIAVAKRIPTLPYGGAVEVWPLFT
jgi:hypothetical protein